MAHSTGMIINTRYRIVRKLHEGNFGAVYRAWDLNLNKPCALKENLIPTREGQEQFIKEAMTLSTLTHANLPRVTDYFSFNNRQYLIMDYVEGEDLATLISRQRVVPQQQAVAWINEIADALTYLHRQSPPVFHRDIKPANIRRTPDGRVVLVDFGLAKIAPPHAKTQLGAQGITPGYSPPEQYARGNTDARTDIYALAATLYTLLTGREPQESVLRTQQDKLFPAHQINPNVSPALGQTVAKGMSLHPSQRYQSAADFKQAITQSLAPVVQPPSSLPINRGASSRPTIVVQPPVQSKPYPPSQPVPPQTWPPPSPPSQPTKKTSPRRLIAGGVATILLIGCCLFALAGMYYNQVQEQVRATSTAQAEATALVYAQATQTVEVQQTSTAQVEATAQAEATATAAVMQTATADAEAAANAAATATANAQETQVAASATARAEATQTAAIAATATVTALADVFNTIQASQTLVFGPDTGTLQHDSDEFIETSKSKVNLKNFVTEATFQNPYDLSEGEWSYGFLFRQIENEGEYRLVIDSEQKWDLTHYSNEEFLNIKNGSLSNLNIGADQSNRIKLISQERRGFFFLNDEFVAELDFSTHQISGDISVATGLYRDNEIEGKSTPYQDFTVSSVKTYLYGPQNGTLVHDVASDQIALDSIPLEIQDFIAEAVFINPYPTSVGLWDIGFMFRKDNQGNQYRLIITSEQEWYLYHRVNGESDLVNDGSLLNLDTGTNRSNHIRLICEGGSGTLYVNDNFITELDLSSRVDFGRIEVASGIFAGYQVDGYSTEYRDFVLLAPR